MEEQVETYSDTDEVIRENPDAALCARIVGRQSDAEDSGEAPLAA